MKKIESRPIPGEMGQMSANALLDVEYDGPRKDIQTITMPNKFFVKYTGQTMKARVLNGFFHFYDNEVAVYESDLPNYCSI